MLWNLRLFQTFGGRTAQEQYSNDMMFWLSGDIGDPRFRLIAEQVGDAFKPILTRQVRVLRAIITKRDERKPNKENRGRFMSFGLTGSGSHGQADPILLPAPQTFVANFDKDADYGYAGRMRVRGVYYDQDTVTGPDPNPTTISTFDGAYLAGFGPVLLKAFTDHEAYLAEPAPAKSDWLEFPRQVRSIKYSGLAQHQRYNSVKSLAEKGNSYFISYMVELVKFLNRIINPLAGALAAGAQLLTILQKLRDAIAKFGVDKVISYGFDHTIKPYLQLAIQGT